MPGRVDRDADFCYTEGVDLDERLAKLEQDVKELKRQRREFRLKLRQGLLFVVKWIEQAERIVSKK